jgi:hypothetical protein
VIGGDVAAKTVEIKRRWCLTADRSRVVPETHEDAAFLHWVPGNVVPLDEAVRLGAVRESKEPAKTAQKPTQAKATTPQRNK